MKHDYSFEGVYSTSTHASYIEQNTTLRKGNS